MKYCVCYDLSEYAGHAFQHVSRLLKKGDSIVMLTVVKASKSLSKTENRKTEAEWYIRELWAQTLPNIEENNISLSMQLVPSHDAREVILQQDGNFDIIVIGTRGMGTLKANFGSVALYTAHHISVSGLYIIPRMIALETNHYLIAVDGSKCSKTAVQLVSKIATVKDRFRIIHLEHSCKFPTLLDTCKNMNELFDRAQTAQGETIVQEAKEMLVDNDIPSNNIVTIVEVVDNVRMGIMAHLESETFTAIVIGAHGVGKSTLVHGSTFNHILHHSTIPILCAK